MMPSKCLELDVAKMVALLLQITEPAAVGELERANTFDAPLTYTVAESWDTEGVELMAPRTKYDHKKVLAVVLKAYILPSMPPRRP
jgi:hypothetical protein